MLLLLDSIERGKRHLIRFYPDQAEHIDDNEYFGLNDSDVEEIQAILDESSDDEEFFSSNVDIPKPIK